MNSATSSYWYLASYPKSGNTWVRLWILELQRLAELKSATLRPEEALLYSQSSLSSSNRSGFSPAFRGWLDDQLGVDSGLLSFAELDLIKGRAGELNMIFAESERYHKVHDAFISPDSQQRPVVSTKNCQGAVYIVRNPEDVVVSFSHFASLTFDQCIEILLNPNAGLATNPGVGLYQIRQFLGSWDRHVHSWMSQKEIPVLIIRYEDMLNNSCQTFKSIAEFLQLPNDDSLIAGAIANTSIDRLQAIEERDGFSENTTSGTRFFRSGRQGEGARTLSLQQRQQLSAGLGEMMRNLSYEVID